MNNFCKNCIHLRNVVVENRREFYCSKLSLKIKNPEEAGVIFGEKRNKTSKPILE
jgi:hypothetical protein